MNIFVPKLFNRSNIRICSSSNFFIFIFEYQIFGQKYSNIRIYSNIRYALIVCFELVVASLSCAELGTAQPQLVYNFVQDLCSQLWLTTFVYNSHSQIFLASFVHNSCSQLLFIFLFTTHVPNSCSQLLLTTFTSFAHNFGPLHLLKTFVYNICSQL